MTKFKITLATMILLALTGCTVPADHSTRVLTGAGYTDIRLGGHAWWSCSDDDMRSTKFVAKGPSGQKVAGAVCCGAIAKNCTIRLD